MKLNDENLTILHVIRCELYLEEKQNDSSATQLAARHDVSNGTTKIDLGGSISECFLIQELESCENDYSLLLHFVWKKDLIKLIL